MFAIEATQFLQPDGRRKTIFYDTQDETLAEHAKILRLSGYRIELEILSTQEIFMEVIGLDGGSVANAISPNGPPIKEFFERMIHEAVKVVAGL